MKKTILLPLLCLLPVALWAQDANTNGVADSRTEPHGADFSVRHPRRYDLTGSQTVRFSVGDVLIPTLLYSSGCDYDSFCLDPLSEWFDQPETDGYTALRATPSMKVTYRYHFRSWLSFGGSVSYCGAYRHYYNSTKEITGYASKHITGLSADLNFVWLSRKALTLYSGLQVGVIGLVGKYRDDKPDVNFFPLVQLTAIGISGGRRWYGFAELTAGMEGFARAGFGYRFSNPTTQTK